MEFRIDFETPVVRGPLTLFPVFRRDAATADYVPGPAAAAEHLFDVAERGDGAVVPELVITNRGARPLLLIEGEVLLGAKQNRTLNVTVLCHPRGETVIPVSCVEMGRWGRARKGSRSPHHAGLKLRAAKVRSVFESVRARRGKRSDQGRVWEAVDEYAAALDSTSPTFALDEIQEGAALRFAHLTKDLVPAARQCGVLVGIGGEVRALDVFDRPETLSAYWQSLLAGYATDAYGAKEAPTTAEAARAFVAALGAAARTETPGAGLGTERHFGSDAVAGSELCLDGATIHLAAFATAPDAPEGASA